MIIHWYHVISASNYSVRLEYYPCKKVVGNKDECDVPFSLASAAEERILVKHDHVKRARGNRSSISPLRLRDNGVSSAKQQSTDTVS